MTAAEVPDEVQQLRAEIEQTRENLGATVEELAAKVDVKNRAQAKVAELKGQVTWQAKGAVTARKYRGPLSAAGGAGLLALIAFIIWHRRKR